MIPAQAGSRQRLLEWLWPCAERFRRTDGPAIHPNELSPFVRRWFCLLAILGPVFLLADRLPANPVSLPFRVLLFTAWWFALSCFFALLARFIIAHRRKG